MRVGLFGGTFNPIHCGHTQVAKNVLQQYLLTRVYFLPSALPPHKASAGLATAADRYQMARMALAHESAFVVSDVEIQRCGPSYTIDTLRHFQAMGPGDMQLFFIVGLDAFLEIHTWKSYGDMFQLAAFIVMGRPQSACPALPWQKSAAEYVQRWISPDYADSPSGDALLHPQKKPIYLADVTPIQISSSRIREMIHQGLSIKNWVASSVAAYIERKGLYR